MLATFGNSSSRTSIKVPASPLHKENPSTAFPTTPVIPVIPPFTDPKTENSVFNEPATFFAAFKLIIAPAIVPIAFPIASITAGSCASMTPKIFDSRSTTLCATAPTVLSRPSKNPSSKAETPGNSSLSPRQNPAIKSFPAWIMSGRFSCTASPILESISPNELPSSSE